MAAHQYGKLIRRMRQQGYDVRQAGKHIKVFDSDGRYVGSLSHGAHRADRVPGGATRDLERKLGLR